MNSSDSRIRSQFGESDSTHGGGDGCDEKGNRITSPPRGGEPPATALRFNYHDARRFLEHVMPPGTVLEMRVFKAHHGKGNYIEPGDRFQSTFSGYYDNHDALIVDAGRLNGVSGFITLNPIRPDLLARSANKLVKAKSATLDEDIIELRWVFVDIDPRRPADISSTDEELGHAVDCRDRILRENPELADCSIYGKSGNGCWILVLVELANTAANREMVARMLDGLAAKYNDGRVEIDVKTKNPARVMCLPGGRKCKGSSTKERPQRLATFDSEPGREIGVFGIAGWLEQHASAPTPDPAPQGGHRPAAPSSCPGRRVASDDTLERYAQNALRDEIRTLEGTSVRRNDQLNETSVRLFELVAAGVLDETTVQTSLELAGKRIGLEEHAVLATIRSARKKGISQPRDLSHVGTGKGSAGGKPSPDDEGLPCMPGREDNPHRIAQMYIQQRYTHPDFRAIQWWNGEFHSWKAGRYVRLDIKDVRAELSKVMFHDFERILGSQMKTFEKSKSENKKPPKPIPVTTNLVGHVVQALSGETLLSRDDHEQPCWVDREVGWPVHECVPMRNGILHLQSFVDGKPNYIRKPTPRFFCPYVLDYDFDPHAPEPTEWLKFLHTVWLDDPQSIETLQEWMGLQLMPDNRYEKIMAFIGPKRAGKGTIADIMIRLVGQDNVSGSMLSQLDEKFALQSMIGKLSTIIDDAEVSCKSDSAAIAERLKSISGNGTINIRRMYKGDWIGKLFCRITVLANSMPKFQDKSGALASRFIVLRFKETFAGREDVELKPRLATELPGIFLWAIKGWQRLRERGRLIQPESGKEECAVLADISSPIGTFVRECFRLGDKEECKIDDAYNAWTAWCAANNRRETGDRATFGRDLRSVVPKLKPGKMPKEKGSKDRVNSYKGLSLIPPDQC